MSHRPPPAAGEESAHALLAQLARALGVPASLVPSTAARLHHLELPGLPALATQLLVEAWSMHETLGQGYELEVLCLSPRADLELDALLLQPLHLHTRTRHAGRVRRSGLVRAVHALQGDGAVQRWRLSVVPWTWLLQMRRGSGVFQERPLTQIVEAVLRRAAPKAAWHWAPDVSDFLRASHQGGWRSYCAYHREAEWDFLAHHLAHEGLVWRWGEDDEACAGHALHLLADTRACPEDPTSAHAPLAWQRTSAEDAPDLVQALAHETRLVPARTRLLTTDYRTKRAVAGVAEAPWHDEEAPPPLEDYEPLGPYAFDAASAAHYAQLRQQAHEARSEIWSGRSTVRTLRAGTRVRIQPASQAAPPPELLLTRVEHCALNNLPTALHEALARRLGDPLDTLRDAHGGASLGAACATAARRSGLANRFEAVPAERPWRPAPPAPRPRLSHCSATVVGPDDQERPGAEGALHTDALGRVRVRFHWPALDGADEPVSAWLRVAQPLAGPDGGTLFIPRIGQEVLVGFLEGDLDRPIVRAALYNGRGRGGTAPTPGGQPAGPQAAERSAFSRSHDHSPSGQDSVVAGGHPPAWHGAAAGEQHQRAALSGLKTQEVGGPGYNQLVFDDTDGQLRVQAGTTQHATWLHLGHLVHQADNHRGSFRGRGFELRTDAWGAVRAARGLLLSTYATEPQAPAGDATAAEALGQQARQLAELHDRAAQQHQSVTLASVRGTRAAGACALTDEQPALAAWQAVLAAQAHAHTPELRPGGAAGGAGTAGTAGAGLPATGEPVVVVAARAGLAAVAGQDVLVASDDAVHLSSGRDTTRAVGGAERLHTGQAIGVLAGAHAPGEAAAGTGLTLIAAQGDVQVQAQSGPLQIAARGLVHVQSAHAHLDWAAAKKITLRTAAGASVTLDASGITVQCPGKLTVQAATKSMVGASTYAYGMNAMPADAPFDEELVLRWPFDDKPIAHRRFEIVRGDGTPVRGHTDANGRTGLQKSDFLEQIRLRLLDEV